MIETIATASAAATGVLVLAGLAVKFALLPWLREHLIVPVDETRRQVTVNQHTSEVPTLLDRVDSVAEQVKTAALRADEIAKRADEVAARADQVAEEVRVSARMFEGHITSSGEDRSRLWTAIGALQAATGDPTTPPPDAEEA